MSVLCPVKKLIHTLFIYCPYLVAFLYSFILSFDIRNKKQYSIFVSP